MDLSKQQKTNMPKSTLARLGSWRDNLNDRFFDGSMSLSYGTTMELMVRAIERSMSTGEAVSYEMLEELLPEIPKRGRKPGQGPVPLSNLSSNA